MSAGGVANGDRPEDQLMRSIVAAMAAYERALIGTRTRAALAVKKARGERVGGVPYGYRVGPAGRLEADPGEQATVARARELRAKGASLREVARRLLAEGHRPRKGRGWHVQVVGRLLAERAAAAGAPRPTPQR